jgi:hypothetical protein
LTRTTPPWYNIQGGLGDNLIFVLASARISKFTTVSHASAQNYFIILLLFGAPAGLKTGFDGVCDDFKGRGVRFWDNSGKRLDPAKVF